jgi:hypothetical protein
LRFLNVIHPALAKHATISSSSSSNEAEEEEIGFHARRPGDSPELLDFTGPLSGINRTAAANVNAQSAILKT